MDGDGLWPRNEPERLDGFGNRDPIVQKGSRYVQFVTTFLDDMNLDSPQLKQAEELALKAFDRIK